MCGRCAGPSRGCPFRRAARVDRRGRTDEHGRDRGARRPRHRHRARVPSPCRRRLRRHFIRPAPWWAHPGRSDPTLGGCLRKGAACRSRLDHQRRRPGSWCSGGVGLLAIQWAVPCGRAVRRGPVAYARPPDPEPAVAIFGKPALPGSSALPARHTHTPAARARATAPSMCRFRPAPSMCRFRPMSKDDEENN